VGREPQQAWFRGDRRNRSSDTVDGGNASAEALDTTEDQREPVSPMDNALAQGQCCD
jgi:hypothetical protein